MTNREDGRTTLLDRCIDNIDRFNPELNAVIFDARNDARERQRTIQEDATCRWPGVLDGVPVSVKDVFDVQGAATTNGTAYYCQNVASDDAPLVKCIRQSGGLVHAKDNLSELSCGATNENETFGDCVNPWDHSRIPGGSSGGSAVAVASGMTVVAYGSDAGGSVRIPAALNGVVGLRPTTGRLPNARGGSGPQGMPDFSTPGPMARRVADIARAFVAVDQYVHDDPSSLPHSRDNVLHALGCDISGMRIGVPSAYFFDDCDQGIGAAMEAALAQLEALGAVLCDIDLPESHRAHGVQTTMMLPQYVSMTEGRFADAPDTFSKTVLARLGVGAAASAVEYVNALRWRNEWTRLLGVTFGGVDLIATPTVPVAPPLVRSDDMITATRAVSRNTYAWSLADVPAISVPCGFSEGLPVGLQLTAAAWNESTLIRASDAYQRVTSWHLAIPPSGSDPYRP